MSSKPETIFFLDDHRGIYIPRDFAQSIKRQCVEGVSEEDWTILEAGPDHEQYWDVWNDVEQNAIVTDEHGVKYSLYQDGALWLIPEGMEWSDKEEGFVWPETETEPEYEHEDKLEK